MTLDESWNLDCCFSAWNLQLPLAQQRMGATVCCRQDSWTGVVKNNWHTQQEDLSDESDCDSDMSQESRVKSQEEFDKFPIPNSQFSGEF